MPNGWRTVSDAGLIKEIDRLRRERKAVILAHNYQAGEVQDIADFVGDSLELSRQAAATPAEVIVFCGVHFMAETAAILSPQKTVLLPEINAGCRMADMITVEKLRAKKAELPGVPVVCYVNSSAAIKAEVDVCCTSANAVRVVESLGADEVLFVPDQYLGAWVAAQTGKRLHLWPGFCPTHARILPEHVLAARRRHPRARLVVHPECRPGVTALADAVLSTSGMGRYAARLEVKQLIVGTEVGLLHRLRKEHPDKEFFPVRDDIICPNMKLTTLEKVRDALLEMQPRVVVPEDVRLRALASVERMLEVG
jgi:quinolinate synthase